MLFDVIAQNTQSTLRHLLDSLSFDHLLSHSDIRNQVRLNAISASRETSAWFKATPIPSLGLDIPGSEFNIALRIWLIPPSSSLICPCTQFIDQYGDHLLGCSCGPYRIRRHNALRDVIYHALKLDNQNVKIEQRVNGDSNTRPGDIYHPDLDNGKQCFFLIFDISVSNVLQPSTILPLLMLVQSPREEKFPKIINIVQQLKSPVVLFSHSL